MKSNADFGILKPLVGHQHICKPESKIDQMAAGRSSASAPLLGALLSLPSVRNREIETSIFSRRRSLQRPNHCQQKYKHSTRVEYYSLWHHLRRSYVKTNIVTPKCEFLPETCVPQQCFDTLVDVAFSADHGFSHVPYRTRKGLAFGDTLLLARGLSACDRLRAFIARFSRSLTVVNVKQLSDFRISDFAGSAASLAMSS